MAKTELKPKQVMADVAKPIPSAGIASDYLEADRHIAALKVEMIRLKAVQRNRRSLITKLVEYEGAFAIEGHTFAVADGKLTVEPDLRSGTPDEDDEPDDD